MTVTVALPAAIAVSVTTVPAIVAVATSGAGDETVYASAVPPNASETSTSCVSPTVNVTSSSVPTATGGWSLTVSASGWLALPSLLAAVTVTVASPAASPVRVTMAPEIAAVAASGADDETAYSSAVPPNADETSTASVSPTVIVTSASAPIALGG